MASKRKQTSDDGDGDDGEDDEGNTNPTNKHNSDDGDSDDTCCHPSTSIAGSCSRSRNGTNSVQTVTSLPRPN